MLIILIFSENYLNTGLNLEFICAFFFSTFSWFSLWIWHMRLDRTGRFVQRTKKKMGWREDVEIMQQHQTIDCLKCIICQKEGTKTKCQSTGKPSQAALTLLSFLNSIAWSTPVKQKNVYSACQKSRDSLASSHRCDVLFENTKEGSYRQSIFTWHVNFVRWSATIVVRYGKQWTLQGDGHLMLSKLKNKRIHYSRGW